MSDFKMEQQMRSTSSGNQAGLMLIKQKVMDYLYYSVLVGDGSNEVFGTCADECGQGLFKQKCCAGFEAWKDQD